MSAFKTHCSLCLILALLGFPSNLVFATTPLNNPLLPFQGSVHSHHSNNFSTGEGGLVGSTKTNYNSLLSGGPRLASFANEGIIRSAEVTRGTAASSANPFSINRYVIYHNYKNFYQPRSGRSYVGVGSCCLCSDFCFFGLDNIILVI